ncbi:TetR/AcrR family transcriptional regulator [Alkalihalobacillus sp. TS-13]|uniref:TetR/AcrR family transcriptional regulator n=1 Tax=Alkalihalobacillus sp. TS-13 TaxID=2842455 RepID=UPI001C877626|nr:TetR/AcrR family transcriptional regulator [Alkalihalobacillus sp. TS-13]
MTGGRKGVQRARMWKYFLDAATQTIEEEGIDHVTIRKIAARAGFTSSTAYNYFKDLSHLKFFAAMRFTKDYIDELPSYMEKGTNTIEKWLYSWECFCKHSFKEPRIYSVIFMDDLGYSPEDLLGDYYKIYESELIGLPQEIKSIIMKHNFSKRSALFIQLAVEEEYLKQEDVELISDLTLMVWKGMMNTYLNNRSNFTKEEAAKQTIYFLSENIMRFVTPEYKDKINYVIPDEFSS